MKTLKVSDTVHSFIKEISVQLGVNISDTVESIYYEWRKSRFTVKKTTVCSECEELIGRKPYPVSVSEKGVFGYRKFSCTGKRLRGERADIDIFAIDKRTGETVVGIEFPESQHPVDSPEPWQCMFVVHKKGRDRTPHKEDVD